MGAPDRGNHKDSGSVKIPGMILLGKFVHGLRALFRKEQFEQELGDEMRSFIEAAAEQKMRSGVSLEEAWREARVELGSLTALQDRVQEAGWESLFEKA